MVTALPQYNLLQNNVNLQFSPSGNTSKSKIKETKLLQKGSMQGMSGYVDLGKIDEVFKKLVAEAEPGVCFKNDHLELDVYGGTCSAQSLSFVKHFLISSETDLIERVSKITKLHETSSIEFRTHQAAYNAICIDNNRPVADFSRAKIASLAKLHDLKINYSPSQELYINSFSNHFDEKTFVPLIEQMPKGIYLVRAISPNEYSRKKENYGHSMVLINDENGRFFYDPNTGSTQIADETFLKDLNRILFGVARRWELKNVRFYRMELK